MCLRYPPLDQGLWLSVNGTVAWSVPTLSSSILPRLMLIRLLSRARDDPIATEVSTSEGDPLTDAVRKAFGKVTTMTAA